MEAGQGREARMPASVATAASPLCALVWASLRWAGPGSAEDLAARLGCRPGQVMDVLDRLWKANFIRPRAGLWWPCRDYPRAVMTCGATRRL